MSDVLTRILLALLLLPWGLASASPQTALDRYVAKPDPNYEYRRYAKDKSNLYETHFLALTSQSWRQPDEVDRTLWQHDLIITVPELRFSPSKKTALLLIDGGSNGGSRPNKTDDLMKTLAQASGSVIAVVKQVPNQPLYFADEDQVRRKEDEILAYSLDKYLDTGDEEWPVHLAMTKSVVRAMDAIQDYLRKEGVNIDDFVLMGGSKRGWTTWLTAAVDPRIRAILPISIDMLNLNKQFPHHWDAYGFYTPAIGDYAAFDLPCRMQSARGKALLDIIDPYAYRDRFTLPKLAINSAGDQFFLPDSSRFYWDQLPEPKSLRYTFNTDHRQSDDPDEMVQLVLSALLWVNDVLGGDSRPRYAWNLEEDGTLRVQIIRGTPTDVFLWQASNPNARDFRLESLGAAWKRTRLPQTSKGVYEAKVEAPEQGYTAFAVELRYREEGLGEFFKELTQVYTTDVHVLPDTLPFAGTSCPPLTAGQLETPAADSFQSGIGVIRGWACDADSIDIEINDQRFIAAGYGTARGDTQGVCGDKDNGFGLLYSMNLLGDGRHRVRALADGRAIGEAEFNVTTLGVPHLRGVSGKFQLPDFPYPGESTQVQWEESVQNFVIIDGGTTPSNPPPVNQPSPAGIAAALENPRPGSYQSGVGVISGWACEAERIDIEFDGRIFLQAAYGTSRKDTQGVCGDSDNGFGLLFNMNILGPGSHRIRVLADGVEVAQADFQVAGFGVGYLRGVSGSYQVADFPYDGEGVTLRWEESLQNFVISGHEDSSANLQ
jgi:PhoPQ-activated pathogenicity-related protein